MSLLHLLIQNVFIIFITFFTYWLHDWAPYCRCPDDFDSIFSVGACNKVQTQNPWAIIICEFSEMLY